MDEKEALKKAEDYEKNDWADLKKYLEDKRPLYLMVFSFTMIFSGIFIYLVLDFKNILVGIHIALGFMMIIPFLSLYDLNKERLYKTLRWIELDQDKNIFPESFNVEKNPLIPYRRKPDLSKKEWEKIIKSAWIATNIPKIVLVFLLLTVVPMGMFYLLSEFSVPFIFSLLSMLTVVLTVSLYLVYNIMKFMRLKSLIVLEIKKDKGIIPEEYRGERVKTLIQRFSKQLA